MGSLRWRYMVREHSLTQFHWNVLSVCKADYRPATYLWLVMKYKRISVLQIRMQQKLCYFIRLPLLNNYILVGYVNANCSILKEFLMAKAKIFVFILNPELRSHLPPAGSLLSSHSSRDCVRRKLGARNVLQISTWLAEASNWTSLHCLPRPFVGSWGRSWAAGLQTGVHCRPWLYSPLHSTSTTQKQVDLKKSKKERKLH